MSESPNPLDRRLPRLVTVRKFHYDGSPVWQHSGRLVGRSGTRFDVHFPAGNLVTALDGRPDWRPEKEALQHFWSDSRWYSVVEFIDPRGGRGWYGNIQLPTRFDGDSITYVDLDLDVARTPARESAPVLLDEDEFIEHVASMRYPEDVVERAWCAAAKLLQLFSHETLPL